MAIARVVTVLEGWRSRSQSVHWKRTESDVVPARYHEVKDSAIVPSSAGLDPVGSATGTR